MAKTTQRVYVPGEEITTEEEFLPGKNTYSEKGLVKATIMGVADFNDTNKEVKIKGNGVQEIARGDIITGKVILVKESNVVINMESAEGGKKITKPSAQIPIRNASTEYVTNLKKIFKIGDMVRARVYNKSPLGIDLATNEKGLGITKAYCSECRSEMNYSNGKLMCLACGAIDERRWHEQEQTPRSFGGGSFDDRRGGHGFGSRREGGGGFRGGHDGNKRSFGGPRREGGGFGGGHSGGARREGSGFGGARGGQDRGFSRGRGGTRF